MRVSINSIRGFSQRYNCAEDIAPNGADELARRVGAQLGAIEEVIDVGTKYQGVLIVKVVSCEKHPNADKLNVCLIDDGGKAEGIERNSDGLVQVVCGAPNVRVGLTVAWLPPGSTVPESADKDPFVLGARELRGVVSNGMLASPRELALGDSHEGILEIDEDVAPGTAFAEHYGLAGDVVFDIENKMFTHRPDCFGFLGVSRELAGIQQLPFKSPDWYRTDVDVPEVEAEALPLQVRNELPELVPRFSAITLRDVTVKSSPVWLQVELAKVGLRPINNIVDYTNFFMLATGQPLHAYDYDKVKALSEGDTVSIVIRHPHEGEAVKLLNGKELQPRSEAIMIASDKALIGVGGVMGGADTEVDEHTRNIIIEVANFDMYSIRRTSMAHGLFTDAVTRFNKGQSPLQTTAVLAKIVDEIRRFADGKVSSQLVDDNHLSPEMSERQSVHPPVVVPASFINDRLGLQLSVSEIESLLTNVEFDVQIEADNLTVKAPFWRTDVEIPEDIVEEVGRLYGYDHLPLELPKRSIVPATKNRLLELKEQIRDSLSRAGANEILSYSFVHGKLLDAAGQDRGQAYQLSNALSPDLQYFRLSLTPSLLERVHPNIKAGYDRFALFEIGKGHVKGNLDDEGLPQEFERVAFVFAADAKAGKLYGGAPYYQAKHYLERVLEDCNISGDVRFEPLAGQDDSAAGPFASGRAANVVLDGQLIGRIGEYKSSVRKALKLPEFCAGFELGLDLLLAKANDKSAYRQLSRFPKVEQDICLKVNAGLPYSELYAFVRTEISARQMEDAHSVVTPVDIFQRPDDQAHRQITFRLTIVSHDKTLRDSEIASLLDSVAAAAAERFGAVRV